jgi:hypothetical protein
MEVGKRQAKENCLQQMLLTCLSQYGRYLAAGAAGAAAVGASLEAQKHIAKSFKKDGSGSGGSSSSKDSGKTPPPDPGNYGGDGNGSGNGPKFSKKAALAWTIGQKSLKKVHIEKGSKNAGEWLNRKLKTLESAQKSATQTKKLPDGRVRYYGPEAASKSDGPTRGARHVTEYNPSTGQVRSWRECYDQCGHVNRVHPKTFDGQKLNSQHYPPTKMELQSFLKKGDGI